MQLLYENPKNFDALHLLGVLAHQSKNSNLAVELIGKAIEINPNYAQAHSNLGNAQRELQQFSEAVASYNRAISLKSDYAEALSNRGLALHKLKLLDQAVTSFDKALEIMPKLAEAHYNRGLALHDMNQLEKALHCFDLAITCKSKIEVFHNSRGITLMDLKRLEEALVSFDTAITIRPDFAHAHNNRGMVLREMQFLEEARASYDRALALQTDYTQAYLNKSITLLLSGKLSMGWKLYEWRWEKEKNSNNMRHLTKPLWLGNEDIGGKTLLLHAEQGLGDTIQFCRYAKLVADLGAKVALEVPKALVGLLNGLEGVDTLIEKDQILPAYDYHCPLMSLPLAFKTELHTIPSPGTYLYADAIKRDEWCKRLGAPKNLRVGLVWSGSTEHKNDRNRSLTLEELLPYLPKGYDYISLQKEVRTEDRARLASSNIRYFGERLKDFSDTAALCALMDVVISVDTSVAHLAGALGKTTWVLLPYAPDWRWLLDRNDSPWYASIKLYRQGKDMRWEPVLERVAKELLIHC